MNSVALHKSKIALMIFLNRYIGWHLSCTSRTTNANLNKYYFSPPQMCLHKSTSMLSKKATVTGITQDICTSLQRKKKCFSFICLRHQVKLKFPKNFTFMRITGNQSHAKKVRKMAS